MVKRLIVACDGTWRNSDSGFTRDSWLPWKSSVKLATPSNVTRICRALEPRGNDGVEQIVYYEAGLGSQNSFYSWLVGGFLGEGISEYIRSAYVFLCNNYEDGDEIFLIGFSRGAFTARSIGGLITAIGLLTRKGLGSFYSVFDDWEHQTDKSYKPTTETTKWPLKDRPSFGDDCEEYVRRLEAAGLTRRNIPIKAIGVWDTVGQLGVPDLKIFGLSVYKTKRAEYAFVNTEVGPNVHYAYQCLAMDEQREAFYPTIWEEPDPATKTSLKELRQCWFPGVHSSVGGGYDDTNVADLALAWMITHLSPLLTFDTEYMARQRAQNVDYYEDTIKIPVCTYAMGNIPDNATGLATKITGRQVRWPGNYHRTDPVTGKPTNDRLRKTHEYVHPSIRYRITQKGPGLSKSESDPIGRGVYKPDPMNKPNESWEWCPPGTHWGREELNFGKEAKQWDDWGKWLVRTGDGKVTYLVEEKIGKGSAEMNLLEGWGSEITSKVLAM